MGGLSAYFGCRGAVGFNNSLPEASRGDGGFTVACISGCRGLIGFKVATRLRPVREKVRPARPDVCVSAKKFAPHAQNGRKTLFSGALGELFHGNAAGGAVLGELFRANRHCARSCRRCGALQAGSGGGFALHEAVVQRVAGVSDPRVVQFPRCSVPHPVLCAHRVSLVC